MADQGAGCPQLVEIEIGFRIAAIIAFSEHLQCPADTPILFGEEGKFRFVELLVESCPSDFAALGPAVALAFLMKCFEIDSLVSRV